MVFVVYLLGHYMSIIEECCILDIAVGAYADVEPLMYPVLASAQIGLDISHLSEARYTCAPEGIHQWRPILDMSEPDDVQTLAKQDSPCYSSIQGALWLQACSAIDT